MKLVHTALHREPQHEEREPGRERMAEERERGKVVNYYRERDSSCGGAIDLTSEHLQSSR